MSQVYDPSSDVLTIKGTILPPSGQLGQERFRVTFPPSATSEPATDGSAATMVTRSRMATLTISCLQQDATHVAMLALLAEQQASGVDKPAWPVNLKRIGGTGGVTETVNANNGTILQQPDVVSAGSIQVVTWTVSLDGVTRVAA